MINQTLPLIRTERLVLRLAELRDVPRIVRYFGENREHLGWTRPRVAPEFYTPEYWQRQVSAANAEFTSDRSLRLFLFDAGDDATVAGNLNFTNFVRAAAYFCHVGYGLDAAHEGKGLMSEALRAAIDYVFTTLNMHRVMANYMPHNRRSGALLRRLGFVVEGYSRDYLYLDGKWEDHVLTSFTNPAWKAPY
jgi:ribosomal-protein-alanine N-acetyltransferase